MIRNLIILLFALLVLSSCKSFEEKYPDQFQMIDEMIQDTNYLVNIINDTNLIFQQRGLVRMDSSRLKRKNSFMHNLFSKGYKIKYYSDAIINLNYGSTISDCIEIKIISENGINYALFWFCEENKKHKLYNLQINDIIH